LRTVAGTLRAALGTVLRLPEPPALTVAGRTDAGVHARGQVCHLDVSETTRSALPGRSARSPEHALRDRLSGVLPADLVVRDVRCVPESFDARFAATGRAYRYRLADTPHRPDPLRRDVAWHPRRLDEHRMHAAAQALLGEHDFVAFCRPRPGASTIRTLTRLEVARPTVGVVTLDALGDAFCHHQVRALVGALVAVGEGRRGVEWPAQVLAARQRDGAVVVAPAIGLTLEAVLYPPDDQLVAQVTRTRRRRDEA
jgi:tRNA pseudouridine38-40 synthase